MTRAAYHGGAARGESGCGGGRPPTDAAGRGRPVTVYLSPARLAALARHGPTPQAGIKALIDASGTR